MQEYCHKTNERIIAEDMPRCQMGYGDSVLVYVNLYLRGISGDGAKP